ncbi:hypothetical protein [Amycolatopsis sp. NPDC004079]
MPREVGCGLPAEIADSTENLTLDELRSAYADRLAAADLPGLVASDEV